MTYLLDTDVFTLAYQRRYGLRERIAAVRPPDVVSVPALTRVEVVRGRLDSVLKAATGPELLRAVGWLADSEAYLAEFPFTPFDPAAAALFDRFRVDKRLPRMGRGDLLNACICLAHAATLVTRNVRDYAGVPGLAVEDWAG